MKCFNMLLVLLVAGLFSAVTFVACDDGESAGSNTELYALVLSRFTASRDEGTERVASGGDSSTGTAHVDTPSSDPASEDNAGGSAPDIGGGAVGAMLTLSSDTATVSPAGVLQIKADAMPSNVKGIKIPKEIGGVAITSIGDRAFMRMTELERVDFPEGLISIGGGAFQDCVKLKSMDLPSTLEKIGRQAFDSIAITRVVIPKGVTAIDVSVFNNCRSLSSVDLGNVTKLGDSAFSHCTSLASVDLSKLTSIGVSAFSTCTSLKNVKWPTSSKFTRIDIQTFKATALTSLTVPSSVKSIDTDAFRECKSLTAVDLGQVTSIGERAFLNCTALKDVVGVTNSSKIGACAFEGCIFSL